MKMYFILLFLFLIGNKMVYLCQNMTYRKRREVFDDALPDGTCINAPATFSVMKRLRVYLLSQETVLYLIS